MNLTKWVLGAALTVAPMMYAQQASTDQAAAPQPPAATNQGSAQGTTSDANAAAQPSSALPQSDQTPTSPVGASSNMPQPSPSAADQGEIYGTGMTSSELRRVGYTDDEVAQLRSDSQAMMASNMAAPGTASGNQDQSPSAANGVSQPSDMNNSTTNPPAKAESNNHAGMWGLLGLLGLLGLAGRSRRQEVVVQREVNSLGDRDRMRVLTDRDAAIRAKREREVAAAREQHDREIAAAERERLRLEAEREASQRAMRDRMPSVAPAIDYTNQDIMAERDLGLVAGRSDMADESAVQENLREKELRDERKENDEMRERKVMDIRERDRNRRRIA